MKRFFGASLVALASCVGACENKITDCPQREEKKDSYASYVVSALNNVILGDIYSEPKHALGEPDGLEVYIAEGGRLVLGFETPLKKIVEASIRAEDGDADVDINIYGGKDRNSIANPLYVSTIELESNMPARTHTFNIEDMASTTKDMHLVGFQNNGPGYLVVNYVRHSY